MEVSEAKTESSVLLLTFSVNIKLLLGRRLWELGAIQCKSKVENKLELRSGGLRPGGLILLHSLHLLPTVTIFVQLEVAVSCSPMLMSFLYMRMNCG